MDDLIDQVLRGLHKRMCNNVLITGPAGVGKRELVHELGRRIAAGQARFLRRRKLLFVECEGMSPESSRTQLQTILAAVKDRQDLIVCLNHFENAIRYAGPRESHNLPLLRAALALGHLHLIALIEDRYFAELLSQHYAFLEQFTRVEVSEPDVDTACAILKQVWAPQLAALYGAPIEEAAIDKAVRASQEFTMSERLPLKAIKALREACEQVSYPPECDGGAEGSGPADRRRAAAPRRVTEDEVISAIARRTGIAKSTIAGRGNAVDFVAELSRSVAGQESAIRTVADRLRLIKAGAVRPGRPAAVFLFAGLTGTGKTELAKAIARVYSASHKLVRYDMTLFALEHSIQGLFGVPPGYVGYEAGGKLINDLNADPYCVVLFDEAEKAHPSIWQGMLSLFDEGWTVDQRNVRAYGNRAIFILTSNAGQDLIRQAFRPGMPESELDALKQEIQDLLVRYENPQTHARPFSPEFLGRVTDVAVFHPLSLEAIGEIVSMQARALTAEWEGRRRKRLTVDEAVLAKIARESHQANQESRPPYGGMGGRIVALEISRQIELPAVRLMESDEEAYKRSPGIHVFLSKEGKAAGRFTTEEGQPS
jgi:ATP-dependent Clp protease ATP-binding subunit ClpA